MKLDKWQEEVINCDTNIVLRSGRQCGKSTAISLKAIKYATANPKKTILVIASVERQAQLIFEKILNQLLLKCPRKILGGKDKPTKHKLTLKNGTKIYCLPTGLSGYGIRGYTIDMLIADEAAFIPEEVWNAVTPMLAVTKGKIILLSTPFGKDNYFFRCFSDPTFTTFSASSEDCPRISKEFLMQEKARMTEMQYRQEYLGEFVDDLLQFFSSDLIRQAMCVKDDAELPHGSVYLGVDIAAYGGDETALVALYLDKNRRNLYEVEIWKKKKLSIIESTEKIRDFNRKYLLRRIYLDDGGLGVGVYDCLNEAGLKWKITTINNAQRSVEPEEKRKRKLMKEDIYNNLLSLMQQQRLKLKKNPDTFASLKSIQVEHTDGKCKIYGRYSHITEALARAAWCTRDKGLKIWIA